MILTNENGIKKSVKIILSLEINTEEYYIYSVNNEFLHIGIKMENKLLPLSEEEFNKIKEILLKLNILNS